MDRKTLNILLIEDDPDYAGLVQQWLASTADEGAFVLNWTDSLAAGLERLAQGGVDVVLLDLSLPDSVGVETFIATRAHAPGIPVIILSAGESESLALQMIQEGAEDYLVKSTCTGDLLVRTVRYAVIRRKLQVSQAGAETSSERARIIGVVGAKGGVGTSTVACNLAAALRHQTGKEVLLADLDVNSGQVSFLMGIDPKYTVLDAISNVDRLDAGCWEAIVTHGPSDLHIIPSPSLLGHDELPLEGLRKVFQLIRSFYRWIVVDLGQLNRLSMSLLDKVDELLVVTTTAIPALYETKRVIDALVNASIERDQLRLIVNRMEDVQSLSGSELNQIFGVRVYAQLPYDRAGVHNACLQRKLPSPTSNVGQQIVNLARKIGGLHEKKAKSNLPEFLSFVGKFRKGRADAPRTATD